MQNHQSNIWRINLKMLYILAKPYLINLVNVMLHLQGKSYYLLYERRKN